MDQTERRQIERQLLQAQRMEAVGQLTGGIAHDFNNFLASISGNLQLLQEDLHDDPKLAPRVLRALDTTERAASVTERLLAFSRQQALQPEPIRITDLLGNLLELLGQRLSPNVAIEADLPADLPLIHVDPGRLESAILNLLFNARDALPEGGTVELRVWQEEVAKEIAISIADGGIGMSPEVLARIYEPFFTTKGIGRGSGLGLSMVYGFITQSGGKIAVESALGKGTKVVIRLPLSEELPQRAKKFAPELLRRGRGQKILLVEDDLIVQETTVDILTSLDYEVFAVSTLREAEAALQSHSFDIIFSDLQLPEGATGLDVARQAALLQPDVPVLFASGYSQSDGKTPLRLPKGARLLAKPYRKADLAQALRDVLAASAAPL